MQWTKEQYASRGLRILFARVLKHLARGNVYRAVETLEAGLKTVKSWLDGTHPQSHKAV